MIIVLKGLRESDYFYSIKNYACDASGALRYLQAED
jgi:hypothetical protein